MCVIANRIANAVRVFLTMAKMYHTGFRQAGSREDLDLHLAACFAVDFRS